MVAQDNLFVPGIEVEGNSDIARVINVTVEALLAAYRHAFPGAGSGGLAADAYAGATDWDEEIGTREPTTPGISLSSYLIWPCACVQMRLAQVLSCVQFILPQLARQLVNYRYDRPNRREGAANPSVFPFAGSVHWKPDISWYGFPWFSALTGACGEKM